MKTEQNEQRLKNEFALRKARIEELKKNAKAKADEYGRVYYDYNGEIGWTAHGYAQEMNDIAEKLGYIDHEENANTINFEIDGCSYIYDEINPFGADSFFDANDEYGLYDHTK